MIVTIDARGDAEKEIRDWRPVLISTTIYSDSLAHVFKRELDEGGKILNYIAGIRSYGCGGIARGFQHQKSIREKKSAGHVSYELLFDDELMSATFIAGIDKFHSLVNIVTRNEKVDNEKYHTFYGSSGMIWDIARCDYTRGTYEERYIQTLCEMEYSNPWIYRWTNVAKIIAEAVHNYPAIGERYDREVRPIIRRLKDPSTKDDLSDLVAALNTFPEVRREVPNGFAGLLRMCH